jgi:hypothetical protein
LPSVFFWTFKNPEILLQTPPHSHVLPLHDIALISF